MLTVWSMGCLMLCLCFAIWSLFFSIMLLFLFMHLMVRWIDQAFIYLLYILNFIPVLIFALFFIQRLIYVVLNHLERSCMDFRRPLCSLVTIDGICQYVLRWFTCFLLGKEGFNYVWLWHISLRTICRVLQHLQLWWLEFVLQLDTTTDWHQNPV